MCPVCSKENCETCLVWKGHTVFIPTKLGVVKMDLEDRIKFPGKVSSFHGMRKINVYIYHEGGIHHGHRLIMGVKRNDHVVDHKNGNRFDWRKDNLRVVTVRSNNLNKGDYKKKSDLPRGVRKKGNKFICVLTVKSKQHYLGTFICPKEAHEVFKAAHLKYHGEKSYYARPS